MNARDLDKRLSRLEAKQVPPTVIEISFTPGIRLLWILLAVHAGGLQDHEAIAEGVARACGYARAGEMRAVMKAEGTAFIEWNTRHSVAVEALLATRRTLPAEGVTNEAAIRSLVADVPKPILSRGIRTDLDEAIRLAVQWVSL